MNAVATEVSLSHTWKACWFSSLPEMKYVQDLVLATNSRKVPREAGDGAEPTWFSPLR